MSRSKKKSPSAPKKSHSTVKSASKQAPQTVEEFKEMMAQAAINNNEKRGLDLVTKYAANFPDLDLDEVKAHAMIKVMHDQLENFRIDALLQDLEQDKSILIKHGYEAEALTILLLAKTFQEESWSSPSMAEAITVAEEWFDLSKINWQGIYILGRIGFVQNSTQEILQKLKSRSIELPPGFLLWLEVLETLKRKDYEKAIELLEETARKSHPDEAQWQQLDAYRTLAYLQLGQQDKAYQTAKAVKNTNLRVVLGMHDHRLHGETPFVNKVFSEFGGVELYQNPDFRSIGRDLMSVDPEQAIAYILKKHEFFLEIPYYRKHFPFLFHFMASRLLEVPAEEDVNPEALLEMALQAKQGDWDFLSGVLATSWHVAPKQYPIWIKEAQNLLKQLGREHPVEWPQEQIEHTLGELCAYQALNHHANKRKARFKSQLKKAVEMAPQALATLVAQSYLAADEGKHERVCELMPQLENMQYPLLGRDYNMATTSFNMAGRYDLSKRWAKKYGANFGDIPLSSTLVETKIYFALNTNDLNFMGEICSDLEDQPHLLIRPFEMLVDHCEERGSSGKAKPKLNLTVDQVSESVDQAGSLQNQIEVMRFFLTACNLCFRSKQCNQIISYLHSRLLQHSNHPNALLALVQAMGIVKKPDEEFNHLFQQLLKRSDQRHDLLVELQRFWWVFGVVDRLHDPILKALEDEPENPRLLWAASTSTFSDEQAEAYADKATNIARRLQDEYAYELLQLPNELGALMRSLRFFSDSGSVDMFQELFSMLDTMGDFKGMMKRLASNPALLFDENFMKQMFIYKQLKPNEFNKDVDSLNIPDEIKKELKS